MKKGMIIVLCLMLMLSFSVQANTYNLNQTYHILQITAEDFISDLKGAGVSESLISSFLTDLNERIGTTESLTEENFNSIVASSMAGLLQSGVYNNLYIAMVSLYSEDIQVMLTTREIPPAFEPIYQTVKTCLLGTGELQIFTDVPKEHWASNSIEVLTADGIVNGMGNRLFAPDETVTREQFVKMAVDCLGLKPTGKILPFSDVTEGQWYVPFVTAAYENQLVSGVAEDLFGIGEPMLRQDMAVIIHRILLNNSKIPEKKAETYASFEDTDQIDEYAKEAVKALSEGGMISGVSETEYAPYAYVTRAQAARMIDQMRLAIY